MRETIWLCDLYRSEQLFRSFPANKPGEPSEQDQIEVQLDPRAALSWKVMNGERFSPEELPTKFYGRKPNPKTAKSRGNIPPAFKSRYVFVNEEIAEVMRGFELGADALIPVELFLPDGVKKVDTPYYLLHFGVRKPTIDRERSERVKPREFSPGEYTVPIDVTSLTTPTKKPNLYYHPEALEGPEMWVDPEFPRLIFFGDRLGTALKQAGFGRAMRLYPVNAPVD